LTDDQVKLWSWTKQGAGTSQHFQLIQPAPPGCIALVINSGGSLVSGTPLAQNFSIVKPLTQQGLRRTLCRSDFYNTWAMGLVLRFHGYDLGYTVGSDVNYTQERQLWAPNSVQIAYPPMFDTSAETYTEYRWFGVRQRDNVFAEDPNHKMLQEGRKDMFWYCTKLRLKSKADMKAYAATTVVSARRSVNIIVHEFKTDLNYIASVVARYNNQTQGFQIDSTVIGTVVPPESIATKLQAQDQDQSVMADE
jgi:hypothetical protein